MDWTAFNTTHPSNLGRCRRVRDPIRARSEVHLALELHLEPGITLDRSWGDTAIDTQSSPQLSTKKCLSNVENKCRNWLLQDVEKTFHPPSVGRSLSSCSKAGGTERGEWSWQLLKCRQKRLQWLLQFRMVLKIKLFLSFLDAEKVIVAFIFSPSDNCKCHPHVSRSLRMQHRQQQ